MNADSKTRFVQFVSIIIWLMMLAVITGVLASFMGQLAIVVVYAGMYFYPQFVFNSLIAINKTIAGGVDVTERAFRSVKNFVVRHFGNAKNWIKGTIFRGDKDVVSPAKIISFTPA